MCVVSERPNPGTSASCSALVPNGCCLIGIEGAEASEDLIRRRQLMIHAHAELIQVAVLLLDRREVLRLSTGRRPAGRCCSSAAAIGSMRPAGMRLSAKGAQVPVVGIVSGSQIVPRPAKSPLRTAAPGTENVRVSDRFIRSPSKLPKKNEPLRRSGPPSVPPNWF